MTPYLNPAQITSGTLAYSFGCGKAIVSTPYWHAEELLADGRGVLVPFADPPALAREIRGLLRRQPRGRRCASRPTPGPRDGLERRRRAVHGVVPARRATVAARRPRDPLAADPRRQQAELPDWRLDHLRGLTDATGMFQHATLHHPQLAKGYCTDDNARAADRRAAGRELGRTGRRSTALATRYRGVPPAGLRPETGRFRNFMGFDRRWLEEVGCEDCHGRALWALGDLLGSPSPRHDRPADALLRAGPAAGPGD